LGLAGLGLGLELGGDDREVVERPAPVALVDLLGLEQLEQVPHRPREDVPVALVVAVVLLEPAQRSGDVARHARLLGDDEGLGHSLYPLGEAPAGAGRDPTALPRRPGRATLPAPRVPMRWEAGPPTPNAGSKGSGILSPSPWHCRATRRSPSCGGPLGQRSAGDPRSLSIPAGKAAKAARR